MRMCDWSADGCSSDLLADYLRPAFGVYAIRAGLDEGTDVAWHDGVASLGLRPMYRVDRPLLEAFPFDFSGDPYGRHLRVQQIGRASCRASVCQYGMV